MDYTENQIKIAELYRITCNDGSIARFTSHDSNITYDGSLYQSIPIKRGPVQFHADLQVDKLDISFGLVGITVGTKTLSIPEIIKRGFLRNARVEVFRIDYVALGEPDILFDGYVSGNMSYNAGIATLSVGSLLDRLKDTFPKIIYSETCNHKLFSPYCGLNKATYQHTGSVIAPSTTQIIFGAVFAFSNHAEGYWIKGELKFTSGNNNGVSGSIEDHENGYVKMMFPFPDSLNIGDTFDVWPGCNKTGTTCATKFNNYANFLGFEYIPKPEVLAF